MPLTILYCAECELVVAAAPVLNLVAECVSHDAIGVKHTGYRALRLRSVEADPSLLSDLSALGAAYPKDGYAEQLEPRIGACP